MLDAWKVIFLKSKQIFGEMSNSDCRGMIRKIKQTFNTEETENEKNVIFALALHGVFIPVLMGSGNGEVYNPSITDSQDSFLQLTTEENFAGAVKERERVRLTKNINDHPLILGISIINDGVTKTNQLKQYNKFFYDIREVKKIQIFKVIYGSLHYETFNFLNALDFCFKIYKTLNLSTNP